MKKMLFGLGLLLVSNLVFCAESALNETLVRVINQINATLPLLDEAEEAIEPNARIRLHIKAFEGGDKQSHPGVRDDLLAIRNALIDFINKPAIEPKTVKPMAFDFVGK